MMAEVTENQVTPNHGESREDLTQWSFYRMLVLIADVFNMRFWASMIYSLLRQIISVWISSLAIMWSAAFLYAMLYYLYIPMVSTVKEVSFQFDASCDPLVGRCRMPFAHLSLTHPRNAVHLPRGQLYRFRLDLEMPESDINWNQGMFMARLLLFDAKEGVVVNASKPGILSFKSPLLRTFSTIFYWPLLVTGLMKETQTISIILLDDFIEGSYPSFGPVTDARIEIEARNIQISPPSTLVIQAHLTGLRHYMYNWPTSCALCGTSIIAFFLYVLTLLSIHRSNAKNAKDVDDASDGIDDNNDGSGLVGEINDTNDYKDDFEIDHIDSTQNDEFNALPDSSIQ